MKVLSSKTDQDGKSVTLVLPENQSVDICVVRNLKSYLNFRPKIDGYLFCHLNHKQVTRFQFLAVLKKALSFSNMNPDDYNTHSFRIGAATSAAIAGKSDDEIKYMGRWKSGSFVRYIRIENLVEF